MCSHILYFLAHKPPQILEDENINWSIEQGHSSGSLTKPRSWYNNQEVEKKFFKRKFFAIFLLVIFNLFYFTAIRAMLLQRRKKKSPEKMGLNLTKKISKLICFGAWGQGVYYYFRLYSLLCCYSLKVHFVDGPGKTVCSEFLWFQLAGLYLFAEMCRSNTLHAVLPNQPCLMSGKMCKLSSTSGHGMRHS